jgi:hypothetical protein
MRFELERNPTEKVVIEDTEFKGHQLIQLRIHFLADAEGDEEKWLPTKKGVSFRRDQLDDVIKYLTQIRDSAK